MEQAEYLFWMVYAVRDVIFALVSVSRLIQ